MKKANIENPTQVGSGAIGSINNIIMRIIAVFAASGLSVIGAGAVAGDEYHGTADFQSGTAVACFHPPADRSAGAADTQTCRWVAGTAVSAAASAADGTSGARSAGSRKLAGVLSGLSGVSDVFMAAATAAAGGRRPITGCRSQDAEWR